MEKIVIEDIYDVVELVYDNAASGHEATFIGLRDDVSAFLKELILYGYDDISLVRIDLEPEELDGYDKEYYVSLNKDMELWCCKAYDYEHECYLYDETDVVLIADDCNSKIIERIDCDSIREVGYDVDEPECEEKNHSEETRVAVDDNGIVRGFEKIWTSQENGMTYKTTYTHYSNNQDMLKQLMENFNIKY